MTQPSIVADATLSPTTSVSVNQVQLPVCLTSRLYCNVTGTSFYPNIIILSISALRELIEKNSLLVLNWLYDLLPLPPLPMRFHADLIEVIAGRDMDAAELARRRHAQFGLKYTPRAVAGASIGAEDRWRLRDTRMAESLPLQVGTAAPR